MKSLYGQTSKAHDGNDQSVIEVPASAVMTHQEDLVDLLLDEKETE